MFDAMFGGLFSVAAYTIILIVILYVFVTFCTSHTGKKVLYPLFDYLIIPIYEWYQRRSDIVRKIIMFFIGTVYIVGCLILIMWSSSN